MDTLIKFRMTAMATETKTSSFSLGEINDDDEADTNTESLEASKLQDLTFGESSDDLVPLKLDEQETAEDDTYQKLVDLCDGQDLLCLLIDDGSYSDSLLPSVNETMNSRKRKRARKDDDDDERSNEE